MRAARTLPDAHAVDAALRQLAPGAERLLRVRFGIGAALPRRRTAASTRATRSLRALEASAFRTLRLNALGPRPTRAPRCV